MTAALALEMPPPKTHFKPTPLIRLCAAESSWGAHTLRVAHPQPICDLQFPRCIREDHENLPADTFKSLHKLTHRLSLTYRRDLYTSQIDDKDCAWLARAIKHSVSDLSNNTESKIHEISNALRIPNVTRRSNFAWIGASGPKSSPLVFPECSHIAAQLKDLGSFLKRNRLTDSKGFFEALAYQLLMIHPLRDGNGRTTRFIILQHALATNSAYAIYFCWRLIFDKTGVAREWASPSANLGNSGPCPHYMSWLENVSALDRILRNSNDATSDERIVDAISLYGHASISALTSMHPSMGSSLAIKIIEKASEKPANKGDVIRNEGFEKKILKFGPSMSKYQDLDL